MVIGVTGGTGFIGRYFLSSYANKHKIVVLTTKKGNIERIGGEEYRYTDYSIDSLKEILTGCDAVVHMAGKRSSADAERSAVNYFDNVTVSENVFQASRLLGIKNLVVLSSMSVYNPSMAMPLKEEFTSPYSLYGVSKMTVENRRKANISNGITRRANL